LTERCEFEARVHDQRTGMREGELEAIEQALTILTGKVQDAYDGSVHEGQGKEALLQQAGVKDASIHAVDFSMEDDVTIFTQVGKTNVKKGRNLLTSRKAQKVKNVLGMLSSAAGKLKSIVLYHSFLQLQASPFDKVKGLIQKLIERLIKEATEEATQKGYCDTETGKAKKERDYRHADVNSLNAEIKKLDAAKKANKIEWDKSIETRDETQKALDEANKEREKNKTNNLDTIKTAKEGAVAVKDALVLLQNFYKGEHGVGGANSASVAFVQEPVVPTASNSVQANTAVGGDVGTAYQGNQAQGGGIIAMLETIHADFERTKEETTTAEKEAAAEHVKFSRESEVTISASKKDIEIRTADDLTYQQDLDQAHADLETNVELMDAALKTLEELNPLCVDTGMSYDERVAKREAEIEALKTAFTTLGGEASELQ